MNKGLEAARNAPRKKRPSMRTAINDMCKWCIYDPLSGLGTWRQQTEGCTSTECPLYELRPLPHRKKQQSEGVSGLAEKKSEDARMLAADIRSKL